MNDVPSSNADMSLKQEGEVRTDMHCHNCNKDFVALLDFSLNGEHEAQCPHCGHSHYRKIENGKITDQRWHSKNNTEHEDAAKIGHKARRVWKNSVLPMKTTSASNFLRERWLEKLR